MRAEPQAIPSNDTKPGQSNSQKTEQTNGLRGLDGVYARIRKLEQRCDSYEERISALRRDCDRIGRKQYRELEKPSPETQETPPPGTRPAWPQLGMFGIESY